MSLALNVRSSNLERVRTSVLYRTEQQPKIYHILKDAYLDFAKNATMIEECKSSKFDW